MPTDESPRPAAPLAMPASLVAETRAECRQLLLAYVDEVVRGGSVGADGRGEAAAATRAVALDLSATHEVDASGLGVLVLAHKRAREQGMTVRLHRAPEPVRRLLVLTKLDYLFEFAD